MSLKTSQQLIIRIRERRYKQGKPTSAEAKSISLRYAYVLSTIRAVVTEICVLYSSCLLLSVFSDADIR